MLSGERRIAIDNGIPPARNKPPATTAAQRQPSSCMAMARNGVMTAKPPFTPRSETAAIDNAGARDVESVLLLKSFDGVTRYVKPLNVLAAVSISGGTNPVWKLNLKDIPPNEVGHPTQFVASPHNDELLYTLSDAANAGHRSITTPITMR